MRNQLTIGILAICVFQPGCSMLESGLRTLVIEPAHYCENANRWWSCQLNKLLAQRAWEEIVYSDPTQNFSSAYADGFKKGYADFLEYGVSGSTPPVPPRRYWKAHHETPEGIQAMQEWFAGFQHGATAAQASGLRQWFVIPTSLAAVPASVVADWSHEAHPFDPGTGPFFEPGMHEDAGPLHPELEIPEPLPPPQHPELELPEHLPPPQPGNTRAVLLGQPQAAPGAVMRASTSQDTAPVAVIQTGAEDPRQDSSAEAGRPGDPAESGSPGAEPLEPWRPAGNRPETR
jgi:hypothetical protein